MESTVHIDESKERREPSITPIGNGSGMEKDVTCVMWEDLNELRENQLDQLSNPRSRFFYLSFFFRANESVLAVQSLLFPPFSFQAESRKRKKKEKESVFSRLATPLSSDFTFPYLVQHSQSIRRSCKTNCLFAPMTKLPHSFPFFRAR